MCKTAAVAARVSIAMSWRSGTRDLVPFALNSPFTHSYGVRIVIAISRPAAPRLAAFSSMYFRTSRMMLCTS